MSDDVLLIVNSDLNGGSPQFTLTCISTGGPATTVTWTRDTVTVTEGTETVLDDPVTAQYTHTLTVTGRLGGLYTCTVTNNKPSSVSTMLRVQGIDMYMYNHVSQCCYMSKYYSPTAPSPPTDVTVSQNGLGSLLVSWTPPSGGADVTGYTIYYQYNGVLDSVTAGTTITSANITGLIAGVTYFITVVASFSTPPNTLTIAPTITIGTL